MKTSSNNSQEPVDGEDVRDVSVWQSDGIQYDDHSNQSSRGHSGCSDRGYRRRYTMRREVIYRISISVWCHHGKPSISGKYCKHGNFSNLTLIAIIATQRRCYISHSSLCYIQAGKKLLKIPGAIIRNMLILGKHYSLTTLKTLCLQYLFKHQYNLES